MAELEFLAGEVECGPDADEIHARIDQCRDLQRQQDAELKELQRRADVLDSLELRRQVDEETARRLKNRIWVLAQVDRISVDRAMSKYRTAILPGIRREVERELY